jgi:cyclophilin family peptidyl-prolyl cis-trans isomerase
LAKKRKECPFCYAEVNKENFERHLSKVHGSLDEEAFEKKGLKKPTGTKGKKKTKKKVKKGVRKRKPKKKDRVSTAVSLIALIVIVSLVGGVIYIAFIQTDEDGDGAGNGNDGDKPIAVMTTTMGIIKIELDTDKAPNTAGNFINLANSGFYNGIIFHRVVPGFVVQGGGFTPDGNQKTSNQIPWESTGLQNKRYTISMARSGDPNNQGDSGTATSQFFINTVDNPSLDGYAYPFVVFGRVIDGFSVVDAIEALPTGTYNGIEDWPDDPPVITSVVIED